VSLTTDRDGTEAAVTGVLVDERVWHRASAPMMGSVAELVVDGPAALVAQAFRRLREIELALSRFLPDSELERLHRRSGQWIQVSPTLHSALRWSVRLHDETDGLFDPAIRTALEQLGYDRTFADGLDGDRPAAATAPSTAPVPFTLGDRGARVVRLEAGARIDLGGVGKGLAADLVAGELITAGARAAYVSVGGDIHAAGEPPEGGWSVPLLHPADGQPFATHALHEGGLVMSTPLLRTWRRGSHAHHHLVDPRTGRSARTDVLAVAVASRSAARGEGLAKAAVVAGSRAGAALLRRAGVTAWIVTPDGVTHLPGADG
jgi:thiamine biosynthesis lipoprotein